MISNIEIKKEEEKQKWLKENKSLIAEFGNLCKQAIDKAREEHRMQSCFCFCLGEKEVEDNLTPYVQIANHKLFEWVAKNQYSIEDYLGIQISRDNYRYRNGYPKGCPEYFLVDWYK